MQHDARGDVCCDDRVGQDTAELLGDGERVHDDALAPRAVGHLPQLQRAAVRPLDGHQGHRHTGGGGGGGGDKRHEHGCLDSKNTPHAWTATRSIPPGNTSYSAFILRLNSFANYTRDIL